ncbi:MAG: RagB/SusD family nutrient uptake outer membrane protein [Bacteroidales bacterium]|nr:RagB/SusD family nutrient uptake outer membrane protein [Bacteroidales bacterium]
MKKILSLIVIVLLAVSCDLTKMPQGSINSENALTSLDDAMKFRTDLYLDLRDYLSSGYPVYIQELMTDSFHASIMFGNRNGEYYKWEYTSTFGYVEEIWSRAYYNVTLANYLEQGIDKLMQSGEITEADKKQLDIILGEAAFLKAMSIFTLTQLYCENYSSSNANTALGVMLLDGPVESPGDITTYVGRSSLADTYKYIEDNIATAESKLASVDGEVGSIYITKDAVSALKARIALYKGDFSIAATVASALVDGGKYPLIDNLDDFNALWTNDSGKECIVQYWAGFNEGSLPESNNYDYIEYSTSGTYSPNYIPEQWIIDAYDSEDIRFQAWFKQLDVVYGSISGNVYVFFKYPGNPELSASVSDYINKVKAFRIAEQYLIAAEANAKNGNEAQANKYLNALRKSRIPGYEEASYSGAELVQQIKDERTKELFGEGFRFTDLKRWNEGFNRSEAQDDQIINNAGSENTEFLAKDATNFRWLWPIPQAEIDSNPQIKDQQNPGY